MQKKKKLDHSICLPATNNVKNPQTSTSPNVSLKCLSKCKKKKQNSFQFAMQYSMLTLGNVVSLLIKYEIDIFRSYIHREDTMTSWTVIKIVWLVESKCYVRQAQATFRCICTLVSSNPSVTVKQMETAHIKIWANGDIWHLWADGNSPNQSTFAFWIWSRRSVGSLRDSPT